MKFKKIFSTILCFAIILSSLGSSLAAPVDLVGDVQLKEEELFKGKSLELDPRSAELSPDDIVRIVVEMDTPNVVTQISEAGDNYQSVSRHEIEALSEKIYAEQETLKNSISEDNINIQYHYDFAEVFNGFSATTSYRNALAIEEMPQVKRVTLAIEYERPKPQMSSSHEIIKSQLAWQNGFDGKGMVVAVLDTGVDPSHQDMKLDHPADIKLTKSEVEGTDGIAPGKWFTEKVPFGYNYMDRNEVILDLGPKASMHGMHVAGSVGANGKIKGVAPEAQILAMKVFGNDPKFESTYEDIYIRAIEDSVKLGADVINMSLGSTASFVLEEEENPARVAIRKATEAGLVVAVSAGNSAHFGNGSSNPLADNPDIGLIGAPSLNPETLSVASVENLKTVASALTHNGALFPYILSGKIDPITHFSGDLEYVYAGLGKEEEIAKVDLKGKLALVQRGDLSFSTKIVNAQKAGAIGVIVFNSAAGGNEIMGMAYGDDEGIIQIPAIFVGVDNGLALKNAANKKVSFKGEELSVANPKKGKMSDFTSWGTTPSLDFKPEITAPGGQIYSTLNNNQYGMMSGTSMASPHVAGGSAVVLQRINKDFPNLDMKEKSILAKNILMNTAMPLIDKGAYNDQFKLNNYVSPRRHGGGVMDLSGATTTNVVVTSPRDNNLGKVSLKEIGNKTVFPLEINNLGKEAVTYKLSGTVTTDMISKGRNMLEADGIFKAGTISGDQPWLGEFPISFAANNTAINEITVPAGQKIAIDVTIDLTDAIDWMYNESLEKIFPNGTFVEGFVLLTDKADKVATLSVPYMGFYGKWDKAPIIDTVSYEGPGFYGNMTLLTHLEGQSFKFLGINPETETLDKDYIYISSQGNGINDTRALMTFLRNAKEVKIDILDENGAVIRNLAESKNVRKNYYDRGLAAKFNSLEAWTWDGKINGIPAKNGQYYYKVSATIDYPGATAQEIVFPVKVDSDLPTISAFKLDDTKKSLIVESTDNVKVDHYKYIIKKGTELVKEIETKDNKIDISVLTNGVYSAQVLAFDYAKNFAQSPILTFGDSIDPVINMTSPEPFAVYNQGNLTIEGNVIDSNTVNTLKVIHEDHAKTKTEHNLPLDGPNKNFSLKLENLSSGLHTLSVEASNQLNNQSKFSRTFFIDKEPALINLTETAINVAADTETYPLVAGITDNFPNLEIKINGNYVDSITGSDATRESLNLGANYKLEQNLALQYGLNTFTIEVKDYAGNISTKEVQVTRGSADMNMTLDIQSPKALELFNKSEINVLATVTNHSLSPVQSIILQVGDESKTVMAQTVPEVVKAEVLEEASKVEVTEVPAVEAPQTEKIATEAAVEAPQAEAIVTEAAVEVPQAEEIVTKAAIEPVKVEEPLKAVLEEAEKVGNAPTTIAVNETFTVKEDGIYMINLEVTLANGNKMNAKRKIFVDTQAPSLELKDAQGNTLTTAAFKVGHDTAKWAISINAEDNSQGLAIAVNKAIKAEEKAKWVSISKYLPSMLSFNDAFELKYGENKFNIEAYDEMGNMTSKEITITRENPPQTEPEALKLAYKANHQGLVSTTNPIEFVTNTNNDATITVEIINQKGELVAQKTTEKPGKTLSFVWAPQTGTQNNGQYTAYIKASDGKTEKIEKYTFEVNNYAMLIQSVQTKTEDGLCHSTAVIKNITNEVREVVLLVQIKDSHNKKVSISYLTQRIEAGKTVTMNSGVNIDKAGDYIVEAYVWSDLDSKEPLAESKKITYKIN